MDTDTTPVVIEVTVGDSSVNVEITNPRDFEGTLGKIRNVMSVRKVDGTLIIVRAQRPEHEAEILRTITRIYKPRIREAA